jgi:predicted NBD/HSP70 family sugar kinase
LTIRNTIDVRNHNRYLVFKAIQKRGPASISSLTKEIDLSHTAVKNSINDLIRSDLIKRVGAGPSMGGRPPDLFSTNRDTTFLIGVQIKKSHVSASLVNLTGEILAIKEIGITGHAPESLAECIGALVEGIKKEHNLEDGRIFALGVAVLGIVDRKKKIVFDATFNWERVPFQQLLEQRINHFISIIEESKAGALGEYEWGRGRMFRSFVFLHFTEGIGAGYIEEGHLAEGSNGSLGEVGHMSIDKNGPRCYCGNTGCWELYASVQSVLAALQKRKGDPRLDLADMKRLIDDGDPDALEEFETFCHNHSVGITNIINIFDPQAVFLAGDISVFGQSYLSRIAEAVATRALPSHLEKCSIQYSGLPEPFPSLLGAASFALMNRLLSRDSVWQQRTGDVRGVAAV